MFPFIMFQIIVSWDYSYYVSDYCVVRLFLFTVIYRWLCCVDNLY